jgi:hypothetical protein
MWALRVAERINAAASVSDWPITLHWHGFVGQEQPGDDPLEGLPADTRRAIQQSIENLLRRFVSQDWITTRLGKAVD